MLAQENTYSALKEGPFQIVGRPTKGINSGLVDFARLVQVGKIFKAGLFAIQEVLENRMKAPKSGNRANRYVWNPHDQRRQLGNPVPKGTIDHDRGILVSEPLYGPINLL